MNILTPFGLEPIESIKVGDTVLVPNKESVILDEATGLYKILGNIVFVNDTVIDIEITEKPVIYFNNNDGASVSETQPIFTISNGQEIVKMAQDIIVGDVIVRVDENGNVSQEIVENINKSNDTKPTYYLKLENSTIFVAEGILINQ